MLNRKSVKYLQFLNRTFFCFACDNSLYAIAHFYSERITFFSHKMNIYLIKFSLHPLVSIMKRRLLKIKTEMKCKVFYLKFHFFAGAQTLWRTQKSFSINSNVKDFENQCFDYMYFVFCIFFLYVGEKGMDQWDLFLLCYYILRFFFFLWILSIIHLFMCRLFYC